MAKSKYWNGTSWEVLGTDASKVVEETDKRFMTDAERAKLAGIATNANNYTHPATHSADIIVDGTTNKAYTATEKTKLAGIETGATADQTASEIKTLYESNANTNAYTDTEKSKLAGIAAGAQVNTVTSVAGKTGVVTLAKTDVGLGNVTNDAQMPIAGGTFTGVAVAQNNTSYTTKQLRNITLSTADPSGGSNGDVWIKYIP